MQIVALWFPVALAVVGLGTIVIWIWFDCPERTPADVIPFLQHVDLSNFAALLDPVHEVALRDEMSKRAFRTVQRKRVHLCMEFLKRMSHNARLLAELGGRQSQRGETSDIRDAGAALQAEAVRFNFYAMITLFELRLRLLIRMDSWFIFGALGLYDLREACGIRGLESYDKLKTVAGALFLQLQSSQFEALMDAL